MTVVIRAGEASLTDWRAIWRGAAVAVDPSHRAAVAASAAAVERIVARGEPVYGVNTGFGKLAGVRIAPADLAQLQRNIALSHAAGVGEPASVATTRLMMALKLGSLAQGASGVQPTTLGLIEAMLARGVTPVVPAQGSVGASGDLAPLAHMAAAMIGVGEARLGNRIAPAAGALAEVGLEPIALQPKEGLALLNGTQFSTANALIGLFQAETLFRSALATGALSTDGARGSDTPFDARIHALRRHQGQIEVAAALRALLKGSAIRASHLSGDERIQDPYCLRCQPQVMGACLDLLRNAAATLVAEANAVSDNPLIFADTDEALSGGNFHAEPVAFAADMIALAICEIGSLAERRIALLVDPALSGLPAFLTPKPGLNSGFMIAQVTAAALVAENKQRAYPASVDSIPTSANQEDHVSMAAHGARRLAPMAESALSIVGIELLAAAQACDFHLPLTSSAALEALRARLRREVPRLEDDRYLSSGHRRGDEAGPRRRRDRRRQRGGCAWPRRAHAMTAEHPDWIIVKRGGKPLVVSIPHAGIDLAEFEPAFVDPWLARKDADWRLDELYDFVEPLGATLVRMQLSRSIIDVNRDPSGASLYPGQATTELCPTTTFDGELLYRAGQAPDADEIRRRRGLFFDPYHAALGGEIARLRRSFRRVALFDAHSIRSRIPRLFKGELPVFNLGTNSGASCDPVLRNAVGAVLAAANESMVVDGRFKGGWITRAYGKPDRGRRGVAARARLPVIYAGARATGCRQLASADRRSARWLDASDGQARPGDNTRGSWRLMEIGIVTPDGSGATDRESTSPTAHARGHGSPVGPVVRRG